MLAIGIVCLVLGLVFGIPALWIVGLVLVVLGALLLLRPVGGRRWY